MLRYRYPLDDFRDFLQFHPWYFWGMVDNEVIPILNSCDMVVRERNWYSSKEAGRADMRQAIDAGLVKLTRFLRYSPFPHQVEDFALNIQQASPQAVLLPGAAALYELSIATWPGKPGGVYVQLTEGYVQALGREVLTAHSTAAVTRHDDDTDLLFERFTATFSHPAGVALEQLGVFFAAADRPGGAALANAYEVAPVSMTSDGTTITVTGPGWLLVRPVLYQGFANNKNLGVDPTNPANFVTTLTLAQRSIDATGAVRVTSISGSSCCAAGASSTADATATIIDARNGVLRLDGYCGCATPKRADVAYVAGVPLQGGRLADPRWRDVICMLACAELNRPICACDAPNAPIVEYGRDLALLQATLPGTSAPPPPPAEAVRHFGSRAGQVMAWRVASGMVHVRSFTM